MGWQRNYVVLTNGERVRYSLLQRPDESVYNVRFKGLDGRWKERSTGVTKKVDALGEAHRIILEEYGQVAPTSESVPWAVAEAKLKEALADDGKRERTIQGYVETLGRLKAMFPRAAGPADVTDRMARDFKTKYAGGTCTRKRKVPPGEQAPAYARKPKSLDSRLRTLKAVFGWFRDLRLVEENPFAQVEPPELDRHEVKFVKKEDVGGFFAWLQERYPG